MKFMKSTIRKKTWRAIYRLLDRVSPVDYDCGTLCGCTCCTCEDLPEDATDFEMGMYLLPGEEKMFTQKEDWLIWKKESALDYEFPDSWNGNVYFIRCKTPPVCPRKSRPLQCRFYPLMPFLDDSDNLYLILSPAYTPYQCPLIEKKMNLNDSFIQATYTVWRRLIQDPLIYDLVKMDSDGLLDDQEEITIIR